MSDKCYTTSNISVAMNSDFYFKWGPNRINEIANSVKNECSLPSTWNKLRNRFHSVKWVHLAETTNKNSEPVTKLAKSYKN